MEKDCRKVSTNADVDLTVLYYTSNREKPEFEEIIRRKIGETIGDTPIITVSQKPVTPFGLYPIKNHKNIVVGDVGLSDYNIYRQMQIGCLEA